MSLDRELAHLDYQIEAAYASIHAAYEIGKNEETKDRAWARLERLIDERECLRARYAQGTVPLHIAWPALVRRINEAAAEIGRKLVEFAQRFAPEIAQFAEDAASPSPRAVFASAALGVGPLGPAQFASALPANRRPVLPGIMRQKGRG